MAITCPRHVGSGPADHQVVAGEGAFGKQGQQVAGRDQVREDAGVERFAQEARIVVEQPARHEFAAHQGDHGAQGAAKQAHGVGQGGARGFGVGAALHAQKVRTAGGRRGQVGEGLRRCRRRDHRAAAGQQGRNDGRAGFAGRVEHQGRTRDCPVGGTV